MKRWIAVLTTCVSLLACGLVHGLWTERWVKSTEPAEAAARMENLPLELGDWQGTPIEVKPEDAAPGVAGNLQRRYVHRGSGTTVTIVLVCGRPGPVSIHTPEACYDAAGYTLDTKQKVLLESPPASFWRADAYRVKATEETHLRMYWGWNAGKGWMAADDSRLQFARYPVLYKLYVLRELNALGEPRTGREACEEFLQVLLPALEKTLFAQGAAGGAT
jgi:hypothetical protein